MSALRQRRSLGSGREYPFEELKLWSKEAEKEFRRPLQSVDSNRRQSVKAVGGVKAVKQQPRPPPLEIDFDGADSFLPGERCTQQPFEIFIESETVKTPNIRRAPNKPIIKDEGLKVLEEQLIASEVSGKAALCERDRLDATCKALGAQLVAAERAQKLAEAREARQAADAAEGRLAFAASYETCHLEFQRKLDKHLRMAAEDVVAKAAIKFTDAKAAYLKVVTERDTLQRDFERANTLAKQDIQKYQQEISSLRAELAERSEKDKRTRVERRDLLDKISILNDTNASLSRQVNDLKAISDELFIMLESKQHQQEQISPQPSTTSSTISSATTTHLHNHLNPSESQPYYKHRRRSSVATPGGLRDLALP